MLALCSLMPFCFFMLQLAWTLLGVKLACFNFVGCAAVLKCWSGALGEAIDCFDFVTVFKLGSSTFAVTFLLECFRRPFGPKVGLALQLPCECLPP